MKKQHKNLGNKNIPEYSTVKEIVVTGTKRGGDKKQFVFLDKNRNECTRNYNQTWREISSFGTFLALKGLDRQKKIAVIGENCFEWMIAYYATLCGGNISVPMDAKLPFEDIEDQLIRCDCDAFVYTDYFKDFA